MLWALQLNKRLLQTEKILPSYLQSKSWNYSRSRFTPGFARSVLTNISIGQLASDRVVSSVLISVRRNLQIIS